MNKNFEVAKILATIAGFFIIASSIFISSSKTTSQQVLDLIKSKSNDLFNITMATIDLEKSEANFGITLLISAVIVIIISLVFCRLGYLEECSKDKYKKISRPK